MCEIDIRPNLKEWKFIMQISGLEALLIPLKNGIKELFFECSIYLSIEAIIYGCHILKHSVRAYLNCESLMSFKLGFFILFMLAKPGYFTVSSRNNNKPRYGKLHTLVRY